MKLKSDAKFEEKLTRGMKKDIKNLVNFHKSSRKSGNLHFYRIILSKVYQVLDKKEQKSCIS